MNCGCVSTAVFFQSKRGQCIDWRMTGETTDFLHRVHMGSGDLRSGMNSGSVAPGRLQGCRGCHNAVAAHGREDRVAPGLSSKVWWVSWSLQWHVPVLLWRTWSEQSCIPFCWHMCLWTRGQSSLDYGLIIDFYECGSNFTKMFFVNVISVPHFSLHFSLPTSNPSAIWSNWWAKTCSC